MNEATDLVALGWNSTFDEAFSEHRDHGYEPARVSVQHRGSYNLMSEKGDLTASCSGSLLHHARGSGDLPAVGDWVAVSGGREQSGVIHAVLPRRSHFSRKVAGDEVEEQVLAANVDIVFLVSSLNEDFNVRRLERYLTTAYASGSRPVVVLTKSDIAEDAAECIAEAEAVAIGVPVHAVSNVTGEGIEEVRAHLSAGITAVLLGSSGVGKSTLVNSLIGEERQLVNEIRADGRGRHTTTYRELIVLSEGGVIIDSPGIRELQLWDVEEGLEQTFGDIVELADSCRFGDCSHSSEPGCAVKAAIEGGALPKERFESYEKLQSELAWLERKQDKRAAAEESKRNRAVHRARNRSERSQNEH
ncbi:MAG: ribosome small subunit-dependent GTPase A [Actinobacteria bacterium]|nr:ribosome small subunit-dependent GTPase A [Actinomycetota bacterium]